MAAAAALAAGIAANAGAALALTWRTMRDAVAIFIQANGGTDNFPNGANVHALPSPGRLLIIAK